MAELVLWTKRLWPNWYYGRNDYGRTGTMAETSCNPRCPKNTESESETNRNAFQQTYLVKPPQILQPVALLMFRVEAIPMFLLTVPIQICQVKLVLGFTAWSSITNGECVHNFHK